MQLLISIMLMIILVVGLPLLARAQATKPLSLVDLAVYKGADREQALVSGAKKEGKVVWYTALAGGSYKELARGFEAKYGVQVEAYRGASKDLISKVLAEAQAKRFLMDVAESSPPLMMIMRSMNLLTPFYVPYLAKYLPDAKEETGTGSVYWATDRESYMGKPMRPLAPYTGNGPISEIFDCGKILPCFISSYTSSRLETRQSVGRSRFSISMRFTQSGEQACFSMQS
jgi:hypothetical protein